MDERIAKFIQALRGGGVRVSLAESADAFRAVEELGVIDREAFRLEPADHAGQGRDRPADVRRDVPAFLRRERKRRP